MLLASLKMPLVLLLLEGFILANIIMIGSMMPMIGLL